MHYKVALFASGLIFSAATFAAEPALPLGMPTSTRSLEELTTDWWQWAMSVPTEVSPVADLTGRNCAIGQNGTAWFLAGGYGSSKIHRTCNIPKGKSIFFPVINMAYYPRKGAASYTCDEAKKEASLNNETAIDLFAEFDGVQIPNITSHRIRTSKCFAIFERVPPSERTYSGYPAATDGFWLLLAPPSPGKHTLKFGGRYNRSSAAYGQMVQDIDYEIEVR